MKRCVLCGILGDGQSSESKYPNFNLPSSEPFSTGFIVSLFFSLFNNIAAAHNCVYSVDC